MFLVLSTVGTVVSIPVVQAAEPVFLTFPSEAAYRSYLMGEITRLQTLLKTLQVEQESMTTDIIGTRVTLESRYKVIGTTLKPVAETTAIRPIDQYLFSLFANVVGTSTVEEKITAWNVFNDSTLDIGAYVTTYGAPNKWTISVNRVGISKTSTLSRQALAELYVHEYGHIVLFDYPELLKEFTTTFWTSEDESHADNTRSLSSEAQLRQRERYYAKHSDRFVSEYATANVDEDMAETFTAWVFTEPKRNDQSVAAKKQRFLGAHSELVRIRSTLRTNLATLQLL